MPLFSLLVPFHVLPPGIATETLRALTSQSFSDFEICASISPETPDYVRSEVLEIGSQDARLKIASPGRPLGISDNTNVCLSTAAGRHIVPVDHDDLLGRDALRLFSEALRERDVADVLFTDRETISADGAETVLTFLKPQWSPDMFTQVNYVSHATCINRSRLETSPWKAAFDGAQDWELLLKLWAGGAKFQHIPGVHYQWRALPASTASAGAAKPHAADAQLRSIEAHMGALGWARAGQAPDGHGRYKFTWPDSIDFSVLLISLGENSVLDGLNHLAGVRAVSLNAFSVADLHQEICSAQEDLIVILDTSVTPASPDWLRELTGPFLNPGIGAVCGVTVNDRGRVVDAGWTYSGGEFLPTFRGLKPGNYGISGSARWYRNFAAIPFSFCSLRRQAWLECEGMNPEVSRPDLDLTARMQSLGWRLLFNPYAVAQSAGPSSFERRQSNAERQTAMDLKIDPYMNPLLKVGADGAFHRR